MEVTLEYVSQDQFHLIDRIINSDAKMIYCHGGSNSGKTYGAGMAAARIALEYAGVYIHIFKSDLSKTKDLFLPPIYNYLNTLGIKESQSTRNNETFFCHNSRVFYFANGSKIFLNVITPGSHWNDGRNRHHGVGGNLFIFDEISEMTFAWCVEYFYESNRLRQSPQQKKIFKNKMVYLENQSPIFWGFKMFTQKIHPIKLTPLKEIVLDANKNVTYEDIIEEIRCETWNNNLITREQMELMKSSGNAARFFYSDGRGIKDYNQIYEYKVGEYPMRYNYFYGMDFGTKANSTVLQLGFGGNYDVHVRELWYQKGALHDDIMEQVGKIIAHHTRILTEIRKHAGFIFDNYLNEYHLKPVIIIDSARSDIRAEIFKKFGKYVTVRLSDKWAEKRVGIERVKKLNINVYKESKFFLNEIANYRYKNNGIDNSQEVPDGNDDLMDTYKYVATDVLKTFNVQPNLQNFNFLIKEHYEKFKNIKIHEIPY